MINIIHAKVKANSLSLLDKSYALYLKFRS